MTGLFFVGMMIPLGTFLAPYDEKKKKTLTIFTLAILVVGVLGLVLNIQALFTSSLLGLFGYQIYMNSIAISSSSRKRE